jgi:vitamin B12 transporter
LLRYFPILVFCFALACGTSVHAQSDDSLPHLPAKTVEITSLRPSDLPTLDSRSATIKPVARLTAQSGSSLASDALRGLSSSLDIRRYGSLGGIAVASFRGLPAEYTVVYRDGVRLTNEQLGQTDLGQLLLHGVSHVELIPSSSAILLGGDAIGSAINFVTQTFDTAKIRVATEQTSYAHGSGWPEQSYFGSIALQPTNGISIQTGFSLDQSSGRFPFLDTSVHRYIVRENNDALIRSGYLNGRWLIDTATSLRFTSQYFLAERGDPWTVPGSGLGASLFHARQSDEQGLISGRLEKQIGDVSTLLGLSYQSQYETYTDPDKPIADSSLHYILQIDARADAPITQRLHSFAGIELSRTRLVSNTNATSVNDSIVKRWRVGSYAALRFEPDPSFVAAASLRLDAVSDIEGPQLLPQVSLGYVPVEDVTLNVAYSRAFHFPTLNDLYWKGAGDLSLQPERANTGQVSLDWNPKWDNLAIRLTATGFYASIDNEILWVPFIGSLYRPINIFKVESRGIEFKVAAEVDLWKNWAIHVEESYTLLRARDATPGSIDSGHEVPYSSPTRSLFIATLDGDNFGTLSVLIRYRGHEYSTIGNLAKLPPVTVTDLTFSSREFALESFGVRASLSLLNWSDVQYEEAKGYPLPGRTFKFSIELNYH